MSTITHLLVLSKTLFLSQIEIDAIFNTFEKVDAHVMEPALLCSEDLKACDLVILSMTDREILESPCDRLQYELFQTADESKKDIIRWNNSDKRWEQIKGIRVEVGEYRL